MDIDNDPSSQTVNVNPAVDQAQAASSANNSHAKSSSPDKLENIEISSGTDQQDNGCMERKIQESLPCITVANVK